MLSDNVLETSIWMKPARKRLKDITGIWVLADHFAEPGSPGSGQTHHQRQFVPRQTNFFAVLDAVSWLAKR